MVAQTLVSAVPRLVSAHPSRKGSSGQVSARYPACSLTLSNIPRSSRVLNNELPP